MHHRPAPHRASSLAVTFCGLVLSSYAATQCISRWATPALDDQQSESEGTGELWNLDATRAVAGLAAVYTVAGSVAWGVGFVGVYRRNLQQIRLFLHYTLADILFASLFVVFLAFISVRPSLRSTFCELLSREGSIMRAIGEYGLSWDNCESWWDRAVVGVVFVLAIMMTVRLQFTLTILAHYTQLRRQQDLASMPFSSKPAQHHLHHDGQRIFLLPSHRRSGSVVYAPVDQFSIEEAQALDAQEAYIAMAPTSATFALGRPRRTHQYRNSESHSHSQPLVLLESEAEKESLL